MKNRSKLISAFLVGTCLFTLVSCGSDDDSSSSSSPRQEEQQDDQGIYRAVLRPLNTNVAGNTSGTVEITIEGDDVVVESNIAGAPAGVKHLQNITTSGSCPGTNADLNNDSYVDVLETLPSTGPILIPLDSNLSDQLAGSDYGPIANGSGSYVYRRSTTLTELLADLRAVDPDPVDPVVKLPDGSDLNLAGRVVVVHGVASSADLPGSVQTFGDLPNEQTLPIACGELVRVTSEDTGSTGGTETGTTTGETGTGTTTGETTGETGTDTTTGTL